MDEDELYEGFGLEKPEVDGTGGGSATGTGQEKVGAQVGEPPADDTGGEEGTPSVEDAEGQGTGAEEPPAASPPEPSAGEEAQRREAERLEGERAAMERQKAVDAGYAAAFSGRLNPYTNRPILTEADYRNYQAALKADQRQRQMEKLRQAGIDPEVIQGMVSEHPAVRQAQEAVQQAEAAQRAAMETRARAWYSEQVRAISALDPEIQTMEDLAGKRPEQYPQLMELVGRGVSLADAYKALNFEALAGRRAAAAKQATMNLAAGKAHLEPAAMKARAGIEVPVDVREQFRDLMPGISDEEIGRQYADFLNMTH